MAQSRRSTEDNSLERKLLVFPDGGYVFRLNLKTILPAAILAGGFLICTTASYGTAEIAKNTKKSCTFCHEKTLGDKDAMKANLTDAGKYYKDKKTLDGYVEKK
jgi:hypothetical protein